MPTPVAARSPTPPIDSPPASLPTEDGVTFCIKDREEPKKLGLVDAWLGIEGSAANIELASDDMRIDFDPYILSI